MTLQTTLNGKFVPEEICAKRLYWSQQYSNIRIKWDKLICHDKDRMLAMELKMHEFHNFADYIYQQIVLKKSIFINLDKEREEIKKKLNYWGKMMEKHCQDFYGITDKDSIKKWVLKKEQKRKK